MFFEVVNLLAVWIMFSILAYLSAKLCIKQIKYDYLTPVLQMPTWIFTFSMILGSIGFIIRSTINFVQNAKRIFRKEDKEENLVFDGVELDMSKLEATRKEIEKLESEKEDDKQ